MTPFATILERAVAATPHAIGGAFAACDGEMVDSFSTIDAHQWALVTAHYGIVLQQLHDAFGTWHYGGPEYFIARYSSLEVVVHVVDAGYYALLGFEQPAPLARALESLRAAARALRVEMQ